MMTRCYAREGQGSGQPTAALVWQPCSHWSRSRNRAVFCQAKGHPGGLRRFLGHSGVWERARCLISCASGAIS